MREIPKRSAEDLNRDLDECPIEIGQIYRHHSGIRCQITGLSFDCKTNVLQAVYHWMDDGFDRIRISRKAADFVEPRFVLE